jgi:hypothetical protein
MTATRTTTTPLVTPADIYLLAAGIQPTDTDQVKNLAQRAIRAGQRLLSIDLYRCVRDHRVLVDELRQVAELLNQGEYIALTRD